MAFVAPLLPAIGTWLGSAGGIATTLGAGASALAGVSAIQQGNYQSQVAKNNAKIAEQNAAAESEAAQREQIRSDREYAAMLGEQYAAQAGSGLDLLGRSQLATRDLTRRVRGEAGQDIRRAGTTAARGLLQDAQNFRAEGRQAKTQGLISGIGSFLEAGSTIGSDKGLQKSLASRRRPRTGRR